MILCCCRFCRVTIFLDPTHIDKRDFLFQLSQHFCWEMLEQGHYIWADASKRWLDNARKKKPYTPPHLIKYGNIRDMTETTTMGMHRDAHGMRSTHKTA